MRRSDVIFFFYICVATVYFFLFLFLGKNIEFWLRDISACYTQMDFANFLKNHLHIFLYLFIFQVLAFYLSKFLLSFVKNLFYYLKMKKTLEKLWLKRYKNLVIIDTKELVAFNFGLFRRYIVLSKGVLNLRKQEKKHIFNHEKTHFLGNDSLKFFAVSVLSSLFPKGKELEKVYKLAREIEVDLDVEKDKYNYLKTLLMFVEKKSYVSVPMANLYINERFNFILEDKEPPFPKYIFFLLFFIMSIFTFVLVYKTCFCGVML